ncbi:hypothetical protein AVEN_60197-1 [Araneus ventricosus]|uniref:Uncharacterized protein n=1 Tax=Araneus ventricosus TaxID=182803 RepID=A0A4Y2CKP9_ARAVE|nr:hypothetical protein AVEN_60197-1 [Araneus ventricosus]
MEESDEYPLNLDSPKRHSDPAPCTSANESSASSSTTAFAFSVPDLRNYDRGTLRGSSASPMRSPFLEGARSGTPSPSRSTGVRRGRQPKQRRLSQGAYSSSPSGTSNYFSNTPRRATHPNASPRRFRRASLWLDEDPWFHYRSRTGSIGVPNGDDKPFAAEEGGCYRLRSFSVTSKGIVNLGDFVRTRSPSVTSEDSSSGVEQDFRERLPSVESTTSMTPPPPRYSVLLLGAEEVGKSSLLAQFTTSECLTTVATDYQESLATQDGDITWGNLPLVISGEGHPKEKLTSFLC